MMKLKHEYSTFSSNRAIFAEDLLIKIKKINKSNYENVKLSSPLKIVIKLKRRSPATLDTHRKKYFPHILDLD